MVHYAPLVLQIHGDYKTLWLQHHMNMILSVNSKHNYNVVTVMLQCCTITMLLSITLSSFNRLATMLGKSLVRILSPRFFSLKIALDFSANTLINL